MKPIKYSPEVLASVPQARHQQLAPAIKIEAEITPLSDEALREADFPKRGASFAEIVRFAYTFDGYAHYGMEGCAALANAALSRYYHHQKLPATVSELRACLFFEARRWTLYQTLPDTKANLYIFALIDKLKALLTLQATPQ